jgi:hypothetical protein
MPLTVIASAAQADSSHKLKSAWQSSQNTVTRDSRPLDMQTGLPRADYIAAPVNLQSARNDGQGHLIGNVKFLN